MCRLNQWPVRAQFRDSYSICTCFHSFSPSESGRSCTLHLAHRSSVLNLTSSSITVKSLEPYIYQNNLLWQGSIYSKSIRGELPLPNFCKQKALSLEKKSYLCHRKCVGNFAVWGRISFSFNQESVHEVCPIVNSLQWNRIDCQTFYSHVWMHGVVNNLHLYTP